MAGYILGVSGTLNRYPNDSIKDKTERLVSLNISISLSRWLSNASLSYSLNHSSFGPANHYMSLSGLALDRQLNWGYNKISLKTVNRVTTVVQICDTGEDMAR